MRLILKLVLVLGFVGACAGEENRTNESPQSAAEVFLTQIDQDNYQESWAEASTWLRNKSNATEWAEHAGRIRNSLGVVSQRAFNSVELEDTLEDMPDSNYAFVFFDTTLEDGRTAREMVALMLEDDSTWRVIGYQVL